MSFDQQLEIVKNREGFIAALDQSGGSTPKALRLYGIGESEYSGEDQMYDRIHEMRSRIVTSPQFGSTRILGAILFEQTMRRQIEGLGSAQYLWERKQVVPFLKVDKGLAEESNGVQLMKPMPDLDALLEEAGKNSVFGTKMRSVIKVSNPEGVKQWWISSLKSESGSSQQVWCLFWNRKWISTVPPRQKQNRCCWTC